MKKTLWGWILATVFFAACEDELARETETSERIGYSISIENNNQAASTRAYNTSNLSDIDIKPLKQTLGGKSVYLHTVVKSTIPSDIKNRENASNTKTRGTISYTKDVTDLSVSAYVCNEETWNNAKAKLYMRNEKSTTPDWGTDYFWPTQQNFIRFYAYSPADALSNGITTTVCPPSFDYTICPTIKEQTDLLVSAAQYTGNYHQTAHLEFAHALTAVQFKVAKEVTDLRIDEISIEGVYDSGTYTYKMKENNEEETETTHWSNVTCSAGASSRSTFTLDLRDENGEGVFCNKDINTETELTTGENIFMMMPQTLPEGAMLKIKAYDTANSKEINLSASIAETAWEEGKLVVYSISLSDVNVEYMLLVNGTTTPDAISIPYYGVKDQSFTVQSYKVITQTGKEPKYVAVPWQAAGIPEWVDEFSADSQAGVSNTTDVETGKLSALVKLSSSTSHSALIGETTLGSASQPFDLSTKAPFDATQHPLNTANSYIVSAPGYYTLPLVYGNAITNGADNTAAYAPGDRVQSEVSKSHVVTDKDGNKDGTKSINVTFFFLQNFKDHRGTNIQAPWIVKSGTGVDGGQNYTAVSAEVLWQDEPCLLTDVELNESGSYLRFRVREESICEGNAVVAVRDADGNIMWSWHIWVTDYQNRYDNGTGVIDFDPVNGTTRDIQNRRVEFVSGNSGSTQQVSNTFSIFKAHLGHCDGETKQYAARQQNVTFTQTESNGKTLSVTIQQEAGSATTNDNAVYYQYGRKDPMLPSQTGNGTNKPFYLQNRERVATFSSENINNGIKIGISSGKATLAEAIQNPGIFYHNPTRDDYSSDYKKFNHWCNESYPYYNLWNSTCDEVPVFSYHLGIEAPNFFYYLKNLLAKGVTKSVYDPCPPGYEMPRVDAFTGFCYDGINIHPYYSNNTLHAYANIYIGTITDNSYNGLSFYTNAMSAPNSVGGGSTFFVQHLGHRTANGVVAEYDNYGAALTGAPLCVQWIKNDESTNYFSIQYARLCTIESSKSLRVISSSDFDLAFGVMPAKSGANPIP